MPFERRSAGRSTSCRSASPASSCTRAASHPRPRLIRIWDRPTSPTAEPTSREGRELMARRACDGQGLLGAFRAAAAGLEAAVDEVNALNVFPVPDGDTGSNMMATVRAALAEAEALGPTVSAERVASAAAFGALMGARGNSGVITSQILRGIAEGLAGKTKFNALDLANALDQGTKAAYGAVAKP